MRALTAGRKPCSAAASASRMLATSVMDAVSCDGSGGGCVAAATAGSDRAVAADELELFTGAFALLGTLPLTVLSAVAASGGVETLAGAAFSTALITPCPLDMAVP